jgi:hypothetical protein
MEYFNPAPPSTITIATGAKGGAYEFFAQQYQSHTVPASHRATRRPESVVLRSPLPKSPRKPTSGSSAKSVVMGQKATFGD